MFVYVLVLLFDCEIKLENLFDFGYRLVFKKSICFKKWVSFCLLRGLLKWLVFIVIEVVDFVDLRFCIKSIFRLLFSVRGWYVLLLLWLIFKRCFWKNVLIC